MKSSQPNGRIRKRTFVVAGMVLLAVILTALVLTRFASSILGPSDLRRFSLTERQNRIDVLGSGISLSEAETANLVEDASFEPLVFRQSLMIISGDATTLTVSSEEASAGLYGDGFFDQASARVMGRNEDGLVLKKNAHILHYGINRVGVFQPVTMPGDVPENQAFLAFARNEEISLAVGEQGLIVWNITGQMPEIIESGLTSDLSGACADASGFLACSTRGELIFSSDGKTWSAIPTFNRQPLRAVVLSNDRQAVAVGDHGTILVSQDKQGNLIDAMTDHDLNDIAWGLNTFVAVGDDNTILISHNGLIWQQISISAMTDWQAADYQDGRFMIVGSDGVIATSDDGKNFQILRQKTGVSCVDVVMLSKQQTILLDEDGGISVSNDSGRTWLQSSIDTGMHSRVIALAGKDKVLSADHEGQLGIAQLVAEIQLDSALKDGQYQAGDLLFLEKESTTVPDAYLAASGAMPVTNRSWSLFGLGTAVRVTGEAAPLGGKASMLLQSGNEGEHSTVILSQVIDAAKLDPMSSNQALQVELWMKQNGVADRQVKIWLSGPFQSIGTTLGNVGTTWKKYSFTFILPAKNSSLISTAQEARLNVAIESGSLWLDRIYLGDAQESTDLMTAKLQQMVDGIAPSLIRLDFLNIGRVSSATENWAQPQGNDAPWMNGSQWMSPTGSSLHAALSMTSDSGADPWLVVDVHASQAEVLDLIEYLAGPISEPYGKLRQELGSFTAWTDVFDRLVIEFNDHDQIFSSDSLKADHVNLMIQTISQSPYYRNIKGKLVFADGMAYSDGVMLSSADYHTSDLAGILLEDSLDSVAQAYQAYYDLLPRNPEKPGQLWPELIRSASIRQVGTHRANLADLINLCLSDLGLQTGLVNLAIPAMNSEAWNPALPAAARITAAAAIGVPMLATQTLDTPDSSRVQVFAFSGSGKITIVANNLTDSTITCQLITDLQLRDASMEKYDSNGTLIGRQNLKSNDSRITVLPGGTVLLVKDALDTQ